MRIHQEFKKTQNSDHRQSSQQKKSIQTLSKLSKAQAQKHAFGAQHARQNFQLSIPARVPDTYKFTRKITEPACCSGCGAYFHHGRWQWLKPQESEHQTMHAVICSACHRIADQAPAGILTICGKFSSEKRYQMLQLLQHHQERASLEHPMHRIMQIQESLSTPNQIIITSTSEHLTRELAGALVQAFKGKLSLKYNKTDKLLRAQWSESSQD